MSVREAVKAISIAGGQGVKACGCISGNYNIGKCVCFNSKVPCNSRCHKGNQNPENMDLNYLNHKLQLVRQLIRKAFLKKTLKAVKNKKNYYITFNYFIII